MPPDADALYQHIAQHARAATNARIVVLLGYAPGDETRHMLGFATKSDNLRQAQEALHRIFPGFDPRHLRLPATENPVTQRVYREGVPFLASFHEAGEGSVDPRLLEIGELLLGLRHSYVCPLRVGGIVAGTLSFHGADPPDERERAVCVAFAAQASLTLENVCLSEEIHAQETGRADRAEEVARVLAAVGAAADLTTALEALIRGAVRLVPSSHGLARTFDPDTGDREHEVLLFHEGTLQHRPAPGPLPERSFGEILRTGSGPIIVQDYHADDPAVPANYYYAAGVHKDYVRSALHVPMVASGRVIGNLSLNHAEPGRFGPRDAAFLTHLTSLAGAAIDRFRLAVRQRTAETEGARMEGALLVARTVAHDINNALAPITGGADLLGTLPTIAHDPTASAYLNMIVAAADSVATKVARLQGLVRLDQTETPLGPDRPMLNMERSTDHAR